MQTDVDVPSVGQHEALADLVDDELRWSDLGPVRGYSERRQQTGELEGFIELVEPLPEVLWRLKILENLLHEGRLASTVGVTENQDRIDAVDRAGSCDLSELDCLVPK